MIFLKIYQFKIFLKLRCATSSDYDRDGKWGNCVGIKCFKLVDIKTAYFTANSICAAEQATLASISNDNEQGIVKLWKY